MRALRLTVDLALLNADIQTLGSSSPLKSDTLVVLFITWLDTWIRRVHVTASCFLVELSRYQNQVFQLRILQHPSLWNQGGRFKRKNGILEEGRLKQKSPSKNSYRSVSTLFPSLFIPCVSSLMNSYFMVTVSCLTTSLADLLPTLPAALKTVFEHFARLVQLTPLTNSALLERFHHLIRVLSNSFIHLLT